MSFILVDVDELDNIGMVDLLQNFNFSMHGNFIFFAHFLFREDLDCESLSRGSMLGLLNSGETTFPDGGFNLVGILNVPKGRCVFHFLFFI